MFLQQCPLVFLDIDRIETIDNRHNYGEIRHQTVGTANEVVLFVVYTMRGESIRIISARRANKHERKTYLHD